VSDLLSIRAARRSRARLPHGLGQRGRHFAEMVVAMLVGMAVLGPLWRLAWPGRPPRADLDVAVMVLDMTVAMVAWMWLCGHDRGAITLMSAVMVLPFAVLLPAYWARWLSGDALMTGGHVAMLGLMAVVSFRPSRRPTVSTSQGE